jgi:hypothetical protein
MLNLRFRIHTHQYGQTLSMDLQRSVERGTRPVQQWLIKVMAEIIIARSVLLLLAGINAILTLFISNVKHVEE